MPYEIPDEFSEKCPLDFLAHGVVTAMSLQVKLREAMAPPDQHDHIREPTVREVRTRTRAHGPMRCTEDVARECVRSASSARGR